MNEDEITSRYVRAKPVRERLNQALLEYQRLIELRFGVPLEDGMLVKDVAEMLGHSDASVVTHYARQRGAILTPAKASNDDGA